MAWHDQVKTRQGKVKQTKPITRGQSTHRRNEIVERKVADTHSSLNLAWAGSNQTQKRRQMRKG
jgi:hypothetical protein